ncbi:NifB/NifX family molybdenum-iron cluster-binding protein [Tissierella sp. Yu-01]|uniref:NifB/NifX family molybdenum-iron cluster-binding protein n=1 Tax=Tissierella sp. Yu-01 TaxID=3035694 RepID=UPI00240D47F2|nr:NifB/NifX family molybdenum-iron cluster-binding protein [Tissierella sp. Yu-01]WFA10176.1 NifB/NifX family molybdenum-iron cluster-binding protein [Tissierella sp. Yu-01]
MKVCFPIKEDEGLNSKVYGHFGSAPYFMIYDMESKDSKLIDNKDQNHEHGMCQPLKALNGEEVDAILVGGIGAGALMKLNAQDIKVYKASEGTIFKNLELIENNKLVEFNSDSSCESHDCSH